MHKLLLSIIQLVVLNTAFSQVLPFKQSVLDSAKSNSFNASFSFAVNASKDGSSSLSTNTDAAFLFTSNKNYYQVLLSSYTNRYDKNSLSNRFFLMLQAGINSHNSGKDSGKHKNPRFYLEPFSFLLYDANRGINYRIQAGNNLIFALRPSQSLRVKLGLGLLAEAENWQMIRKSQLADIENYPEAIKRLIYDTVGISKSGSLKKNNIRANLYSNFNFRITETFNVNAFLCFQQPFKPPYQDLPQIPQFPIVTKLYPRLSADIRLTFRVWKRIELLSMFFCQYDKGQIPQYVPNFVYNFSEGFNISF